MKKVYWTSDLMNWFRIVAKRDPDKFYTVQQIVNQLYRTPKAYRATEINLKNLFDDGKLERCGDMYRLPKD